MIMMLLSILVCSCCCCYSCLAQLKYCLHSSNKCSNISFYYFFFFAKKYKEIHYDVDVDEDFNVEMQKIWVNTFIELAEMSLNGFFMKRKNKIWFLKKRNIYKYPWKII